MIIEVPVLTVFLGNAEDKDTSARDALWIKPVFLPSLSLLSPPQLPALASAEQDLVHTGGFGDLLKAELSAPYLNMLHTIFLGLEMWKVFRAGGLRRKKKPSLQKMLTWLKMITCFKNYSFLKWSLVLEYIQGGGTIYFGKGHDFHPK